MEAILSDMREPYNNVADAAVPNAGVCIDPFQESENASKVTEDIRKTSQFGSK
jgi:hypothetical protein